MIDLVSCDDRYRALVDRLLGSVIVVETREAAAELAHASAGGMRFVSLDGEVWERGEGSFLVCWAVASGFRDAVSRAVRTALALQKLTALSGYRLSVGVAPGVGLVGSARRTSATSSVLRPRSFFRPATRALACPYSKRWHWACRSLRPMPRRYRRSSVAADGCLTRVTAPRGRGPLLQ